MQGLTQTQQHSFQHAEHGSQTPTLDGARDSSNRDNRAECEKFLREMTKEESEESGIVFYESWCSPDINIISFRHGYVGCPSILTSAIAERDSSE